MNAVDKYYRTKHELLQEGSYAVKIFCDASLKDGVLVSAIYIDDHIRIHTKTKYLKNEKNIQKGEAYAIKMALDHIAKHFYKEAIIYTEIDSIIHTHLFSVVLGKTKIQEIPKQLRPTARMHQKLWSQFRYVYRMNKRIVLQKIESNKNPAHAIACQKREEFLHPRVRPAWKRWMIFLCNRLIAQLSK